MNSQIDLLIVGAGPAGMSAAIKAQELGISALVVDEQPEPGGQIWRSIERVGTSSRAGVLGAAYVEGLEVVERFRKSGATFSPETTLWHIEEGPIAYIKSDGSTKRIAPAAILLATGAQERPTPFRGWTLPGVLTVGAGQILLKSAGQLPEGPIWIAGTGPLAYLYAAQLLDAGGELTGFLDTRPKGRIVRNLATFLAAMTSQPQDILKGLQWLSEIKRHCRYVPNVHSISVDGKDHVEQITFESGKRLPETVSVQHLLVHEGIIPAVHPTMALGCEHEWNDMQECFSPSVNGWGETTSPFVFVAGDLAGIAGAKAASIRGEIAAIGIAHLLGRLSEAQAEREAAPHRRHLAKSTAVRPFLDRVYRPRTSVFIPDDDALVCRCEEVSAGKIRALCRDGKGDPNRIKAFSRAGMGACQGRLCNYTVANILADETGSSPGEIGLYRVRPPFKPVTLDELARLQLTEGKS